MGDIDIKIDIDGHNRVARALRDGLKEGLDDAGEFLMNLGKQNARAKVVGHDRVWNKKVKRGFRTQKNQFNRYYHWKGQIRNEAPHAEIVEKGLAPAGEITGSTPSVQDILPWVDSEITPNAAAQASAEAADLSNWDPEIRVLAEEYGTADVIAAFAIAKHIKDSGYPGIYFMEKTEPELKSQTLNVKNKVEKEMNRKLREAGLK